MHLQGVTNREVALLTQERDDILAERNLYRKQLSDALSDLKMRHSEILDLKQQYNDVCIENLDMKQQYNDVCSELADVKRELARERLQLSAGTVHSQGKGVLGGSAESITMDNSDISSDFTTVSTSSIENDTAVDVGAGRSFSETQVTGRTSGIAKLPKIAEPRPETMQLSRLFTPLPAERTHTPLPVVDDIDGGPVPPLPMSENLRTLAPSPVPVSALMPTQDHIPPFVESGSMETPDGLLTKNLILSTSIDGFREYTESGCDVSRRSARIIDVANQSQCETDAQTMKDVVNVIYETAVKGEALGLDYGEICKEIAENVAPNVRDMGTRDAEGIPIRGGRLFKKILLRRCKVDFERWISLVSRKHPVSKEADSESVDWDEKDVSNKSDQSAQMLNLLGLLGSLYRWSVVPERVIIDCTQRLLTLSETAGASAHVCTAIEGMSKLLLSAGPELHHMKTRGQMDECFERLRELAWPQNSYTKDVGIVAKGILRNLIDYRGRKWLQQ